ncbi:MAG: flagellar biosynthetic protein FliO [Proteobacteria bacterium]|nr:flagellar biosynthetic protein FliO [Pseudomonadota bacterium]
MLKKIITALLLILLNQLALAQSEPQFASNQTYGDSLLKVYLLLIALLVITFCLLIYLKRKKGVRLFKPFTSQGELMVTGQQQLSTKVKLYTVKVGEQSFLIGEHPQMLNIHALNTNKGAEK